VNHVKIPSKIYQFMESLLNSFQVENGLSKMLISNQKNSVVFGVSLYLYIHRVLLV
jgi:hypothetical protein